MSRWAIVAWGSLLCLTACNNGVAVENLPEETASAICDTAAGCLGRLADRQGLTASCTSGFGGELENGALPQWQAAIDKGTTSYDPARGADCINAVRALGCDILIAATPEACRTMFTGTVALGGACSINEECAGDAYCASAACPDTAGTCTARKASGTACGGSDECQTGLVCEMGTCRVPGSTSGGSCGGTTNLGCPLDETCVGATGTTAGTCTPLGEIFHLGLGESCDPFNQDLCTTDLSCAATGVSGTMLVASCVAIAAPGGACNAAVPDMCPSGQHCDAQPGMGMFDGTCQPDPTEGQPCAQSATGGSICAGGLSCIDNTCTRVRNNGEACETASQCFSGICDGGTCAAPQICT